MTITSRPRLDRTSVPATEIVVWDVVVRREVRPLIDQLAGKRAGYADVYKQLQQDPCAERTTQDGTRPFAYRLSGPLEPKVCGVHLKNGYRLAFSMQPADDADHDGRVVVLYVGARDTRDRSRDVWRVVHDLFDSKDPSAGHLRPPCCEHGLPALDDGEFTDVMRRLRRLLRGR